MEQRRELLVEVIRIAERARDLLAGLERRLKETDRSDLEEHLGRLERLAGSLPEAHPVRLLADSAVGSARVRGAGYAGFRREQVPLEDRGEGLDAPRDTPYIPVGRTARRVSGDYSARAARIAADGPREAGEGQRDPTLLRVEAQEGVRRLW